MASGVQTSGTISGSGVAVTAGTVPVPSGPAVKSVLTYFGYEFRATAAAVVRVRQKDASGPILSTIGIATIGESKQAWFGPQGRRVADDIFVEVVSGTIEGIVYFG